MHPKLQINPARGYFPGAKHQILIVILHFGEEGTNETNKSFAEQLQNHYYAVLRMLDLVALTESRSPVRELGGGKFLLRLSFHEAVERLCIALVNTAHSKLKEVVAAGSVLPEASLSEIADSLKKRHLGSKNPRRVIQALIHKHIPSLSLTPQIQQIGWGSNARLMDSSVSDKTSAIGINIAANKKTTSDLLRIYGLPASKSIHCVNEAAALEAAKKIGFPVVVKPADRERGAGVFALIDSDERLISAFNAASKLSKQVLVEKHFDGHDYRIQIYEGVAYSVTHRRPGGITGNGINTVIELLESLNSERRNHSQLRQLEFDEDARSMLARQNLRPESVPAVGQFVALRSVANVDRGGVSNQVIDLAHPDNLALAARAARIVNLDIAGIDLLISDISQSWRKVGALICEVNARPMINAEAIERLLQMMMPQTGYRLPSLLITVPVDITRLNQVAEKLNAGIGIASAHGAWVNGLQVSVEKDLTVNGRALLLNREVRFVLNCITPEELPATSFSGFPCDRYGLAIVSPQKSGEPKSRTDAKTLLDKTIWGNIGKIASRVVPVESLDGKSAENLLKKFVVANQPKH